MSNKEEDSYRQIIKATSIFGGVQVFNIAISVVRSKAIALLLGPAGIGIAGLLTSTTGLISSLTNFGLGTSAVKDISEAHTENNYERMGKTTAVFRKLVWLTGALGAIFCIILSPWLSQITFGNSDYTWSFVFLSISILIGQLTVGQNVLLQGTRNLKYLAFANILGSIVSVIVTVPLYFFYGQDGIVPAIIIMALVTFAIAKNFSRKVNIQRVKIRFSESLKLGNGMLKLGLMLSLSGIVSTIVAYLVRIFIGNTGSILDVGLFSAGFQIIGTYVGMVFTAMGTDYYPRLTGVANDDGKRNKLVNQQGEIAILILFPIILIFLVFAPYIVKLFYSSKFYAINDMIIWAAFAMLFKAGSWTIAFQFLAKGSSKLFFINEFTTNIYLLIFDVLGYHYFGLTGLGYSFLATYIIYMLQVYFVSTHHYNFSFDNGFLKIFTLAVVICGLCLILVMNTTNIYAYMLSILFIFGASGFSIYQLNMKTGILAKIKWRK